MRILDGSRVRFFAFDEKTAPIEAIGIVIGDRRAVEERLFVEAPPLFEVEEDCWLVEVEGLFEERRIFVVYEEDIIEVLQSDPGRPR